MEGGLLRGNHLQGVRTNNQPPGPGSTLAKCTCWELFYLCTKKLYNVWNRSCNLRHQRARLSTYADIPIGDGGQKTICPYMSENLLLLLLSEFRMKLSFTTAYSPQHTLKIQAREPSEFRMNLSFTTAYSHYHRLLLFC